MDVSREDIDKLTSAIQGMTGSLGRASASVESEKEKAKSSLRDTLGAYAKNSKDRARSLETTIFQTEDKLRLLTGTLRDTAMNMRRMMGGVFGGAIVGLVLQKGSEMARTFSDMNEIGQNFGGSMLKMHQAAAAAGLPLSDFAELVKKNGEVMAKMGTEDFAKLAHNVRNVIEKQGMYGYSIDQINDQLGQYMQTSALYGTANLMQTKNSTGAMVELAMNTSILSDVTKKSREEITKLANEAMRTALALGGMNAIPVEMREATHKTMANVMAVFAAQQGEAGTIMTKFLGDTFGAGFSGLTEMGKTINGAGLGNLLSDMDVLAEKVKNNSATQEDAIKYSNEFKKSVEDNSQMLTTLAASGNAQAAQMLTAAAQMKYISAEEMAKAKQEVKQRAALTKLFGGFENALGNVITSIQTGFYKGIAPFLEGLGKLADGAGGWDYFQKKAQSFGEWLGVFLTNTLTAENTRKFTDIMDSVFNVGKSLIVTLTGVGKLLLVISPILASVAGGLMNIVSFVEKIGETIGGVVDSMLGTGHKFQKGMGGILAALTILFGPKLVKGIMSSFIKNFFMSKTMDRTIMARHVTVIGPGGEDDFGGLGGGGGGKSGPRKGFRERLKGAGRGIGGRLKGAGRGIGRGLGHLKGRAGALAGVGIGLFGLLGATSAFASTGDESEKDPDAATPARSAPMQVMNAQMIKDANQREAYENLMKQKLELQKLPQTDENKSKLDTLNGRLKPFSQQYGLSVTDPHDFDYASLHGKLPAGAKYKGISAPQGRSIPSAAKPTPKQKDSEGGMNWLDYASMGLGAASFIPGLGIVTGALGAGVDIARGDYVGAGLSAASMIPLAGDVAAAGKMARFGMMASKIGKGARITQGVRDWGGAGLAVAGAAVPSMFGYDDDKQEMPNSDYTDYTAKVGPSSDDLMNKMMSQSEDQNKMIISLLAQLTKLQAENTKMLTRVVTTRS